MGNDLIYNNVATELLEIFKYLEKTIKEKIPIQLEKKLISLQNKEYIFKIDKTKSINEQNLLPETRQILSMIYLKYCCTEDEVSEILKEKNKRELEIERIKREKYNVDNIFSSNIKKENSNNVEMVVYEDNSTIYKKIINKIKAFFQKIVRK